MRITHTAGRIILAGFYYAILGVTPAIAAASTTVPSYQPYYYMPAEQERTPVADTAAAPMPPSVEVFPAAAMPPSPPPQPQLVVAPQPIPTTVSETMPPAPPVPVAPTNINTVKNLNDELPASMKESVPVPNTNLNLNESAATVISTSPGVAAMPSSMPPPLPQPGPPAMQQVPLPAAATLSAPAPMPAPKTNLNFNAPEPAPVTLDQLPSYQNTPDFDQHRNWTTPKAVDKKPDDDQSENYFLSTPSGVDIAALFEGYHYQEPDAGGTSVNLNGIKYGLDVALTTHFDKAFFGSAEVEYARGLSNYHGSGTTDNHLEQLWDARGLVGFDVASQVSGFGSAFYSGLGYRQLYSNDQGSAIVGATNYLGYRRENQMVYLPAGIKPRWAFDGDSRLEALLEGDILLWGQQTSWLGDTGDGDPTLHNEQKSGYGVRTGLMWQTKSWGFGPYLNYWGIHESQGKIFVSPNSTCGASLCVGTEPTNHTIEYGVKADYHFDAF